MNIKVESNISTRNTYAGTQNFAAYVGGGDDPKPKKTAAKPAIAAKTTKKPAPYTFKDPTYQQPIKNTHPDYIAYKKQLDQLKKNAPLLPNSPFVPQQISATPVTSPYAQGQKIGTQIATTTGGQIVILGETHTQTEQADVLVGVVRGLKAKGDTRQIIFIDEQPKDTCTNETFTSWNATALQNRKAGTLGNNLCGAISAQHYTDFYNRETLKGVIDIRHVLNAKQLNELSRLAPTMLAFNIDVNHDHRSAPYIDRDTAMAMSVKKLREKYPDAIIIGGFGGNHATEIRQDKPNTPNNINYHYSNLNDPMAEQLALLYGHNAVHTICVVPKGDYLNDDCNFNEVHKNTGQFNKVITVTPQDPKKPWAGGEWEKRRW